MRLLLRALQLIYFAFAALLFLSLMIPVALFAVLASFAGALRGGNLIYIACKLWADIWFFLVGIFHRNTCVDSDVPPGPYIYIANHISWLDAALIPKIFRKPIRPLGKAEVGRIPVFGYIYKKAVVSVDRSSPESRKQSIDRLKSILRKGVSVLVFPEGTFNETHEPMAPFYDGAFRIAIETGTPIRPVLILDSYARMPYDKTFSLNPGRSRAVFLEDIHVDGLGTADVAMLRELARSRMAAALLEYGADWIKPQAQ
jgi:1-acyl-sn-glycerol-3-phosphate acyltransferase